MCDKIACQLQLILPMGLVPGTVLGWATASKNMGDSSKKGIDNGQSDRDRTTSNGSPRPGLSNSHYSSGEEISTEMKENWCSKAQGVDSVEDPTVALD